MVFPAHDGNELVHDAARHPGIVVFGLLAEQRFLNRIEVFAGDDFEQRGRGDLEGCAAGKAAAERDVRVNQRVKAAGILPSGKETSDDTGGIIRPVAFRKRLERLGEVNRRWLAAVGGSKLDLFRVFGRTVGSDDGVTLNRHRKHKAVVVVGVLTNDVNAAGRGHNPARRAAIGFFEFSSDVGGEFFEVHGKMKCK